MFDHQRWSTRLLRRLAAIAGAVALMQALLAPALYASGLMSARDAMGAATGGVEQCMPGMGHGDVDHSTAEVSVPQQPHHPMPCPCDHSAQDCSRMAGCTGAVFVAVGTTTQLEVPTPSLARSTPPRLFTRSDTPDLPPPRA